MRTILTPLILSVGTAYGDGDFDGGCVRPSRDGDQIGIIRVDGSHEPTATLIPAWPWPAIGTRCQVTDVREPLHFPFDL